MPCGSGRSSKEESKASIMAKSMEGSSILSPPAIFTKTSFMPKAKPPRFSKTANKSCSLLKSKPVTVLWGVPYTLCVTKACTSINKGRMPSIEAAIVLPLKASFLWAIKKAEGFVTTFIPSLVIS